jgi:hypothetical protein
MMKVTALVTIAIFLFASLPHVSGASAQDATTAIASANQALQTAFANVLNAEKSGVNVSVLMYQLDTAGLNLTSAEVAFSNDDYSQAVNLAGTSEALVDRVATDAVAMKAQASDWFSSFLPTLIMSSVISCVFVMVLAFTWIWFKRHYLREMAESRPRVAGQ